MRFKQTGKKILCIRTTYNPDKKRGEDKTVVSVDRWAEKVPEEALSLLTSDEAEQLQNHLQQRQAQRQSTTEQLALTYSLPDALERAVSALKSPENVALLKPEVAAKIWKGLDDMRRELRKAGFARPGKDE